MQEETKVRNFEFKNAILKNEQEIREKQEEDGGGI